MTGMDMLRPRLVGTPPVEVFDTGPGAAPDSGPDGGPDTGPDTGPTTGPTTAPAANPAAVPGSGPSSGPSSGPGSGSGSGRSRPVVLLHSSASGAHQWQALIAQMPAHRRAIAPNLLGYGHSAPRDAASRRSAACQAAALLDVLEGIEGPIDLVGHSFGAVVALELAAALGPRAGRAVLFEPNAFGLLDAPGFEAERAEIRRLHARVQLLSRQGAWPALAAQFADFFSGPGTWAAMPAGRRQVLAAALRHNADEWAAVMPPALEAGAWPPAARRGAPPCPAPAVLLAWARDSPAPLRAVVRALRDIRPHWARLELPRGGHLAPLNRPRAFNAAALRFLDGEAEPGPANA